jgi:hypothetical protein
MAAALMPETQQIQATEVHYRILADVDDRKVIDQIRTPTGETPVLLVPGEEPAVVSRLVWDLEELGWVWRPADDVRWQLTDAGRLALAR